MKNRENSTKIKKRIQAWGWRQGVRINTKVHDLSYFFWETTLSCNLNCKHCGSSCGYDMGNQELPADKVLNVFRDISEHYDAHKIMVAVTGGEPLVRKDLFDILSEVSKMGFPWGMVTNGMLVNKQIVEKCHATGMKTVSVSIDGIGPSHNWLRNNETSYERALNALELFAKSKYFTAVEAITCVNKRNVDQLEDMYEILKKTGVTGWRIFNIFPKGRAEFNEELTLNKQLIIKIFNFIKDKRKNGDGIKVSYSEEGYLGCEWEREVRDNFFYCGAGIHVGSLLSDGSFSACPSLSSEWIQGHVDSITFTEAWETRYKNMRDRKWMKVGECSCCEEWKNCIGGSLHLWDWKEGHTKGCHFQLLKQ